MPAAETNPDVKTLPPEMFPVVLTTPPGGGIKLPTKFDATILPVELIRPLVSKLPPITLPVELINPDVKRLPLIMLAVALIDPLVSKLPPMILPLTLSKPVTYSPDVANTTTFDVPPTSTVMLPPDVAILIFDVPLLILATEVITPVNKAPLPKI